MRRYLVEFIGTFFLVFTVCTAVLAKAGLAPLAIGAVLAAMIFAGGHISDHDYLIATKIAEVMCGGEVEGGSLVDEQWFLDLERRHFMELIATEKTQARIEHMLKAGKPLRN